MTLQDEFLPLPNDETLSELSSRYQAKLAQIQEKERLRPRVSRTRALALTRQTLQNFHPLQAEAKRRFHGDTLQEYERAWNQLPECTFVYYKADLDQEKPWTPKQLARRQELSQIVRSHDRRFTRWAQALFFDETIFSQEQRDAFQKQIEKITKGTGSRDDAEDVLWWGDLFLQYPTQAFAIPYLQEAQIKKAQQEAHELIVLLSDDGKAPAQNSPRDLWWRSFTLWSQHYNTIADLGRFLLGSPPNAEELFPKINPERNPTQPPPTTPNKPTP
ncbi:hypothetical protein L6R29_07580 [Myxococcota bacterium]|nr:hypothetical protein [Myxococcota bacterium]